LAELQACPELQKDKVDDEEEKKKKIKKRRFICSLIDL
jgi:hypothetical protein